LTSIFRDREKLSPRFVPPKLAHREQVVSQLVSIFSDAKDRPHECNLKTIQLIGPSGSGKTSCVQLFAREFEESCARSKLNLRHLYVNLKLHGGSRVILYRHILESVAPEILSLSQGADEMLSQLVRYLREKGMYLLISLDELDYFLKSTKDTTVIYDLARLNEIDTNGSCNVLGIIFVARNTEFHKRLDPAELSSLGRIPIFLRHYTGREIADILSDRIALAFLPSAIGDDVVRFVSNIASSPPGNGDARYALDLLLYSGMYAESLGADSLTPDHVRALIEQMHPTITEEEILSLPKKAHVLVLLAVVLSLRGRKKPYSTLKEIREEAETLERSRGGEGIAEDLEELLQDLCDRGIVEIRSLTEIGISGVPVDKLQAFLDSLFSRLASDLGREGSFEKENPEQQEQKLPQAQHEQGQNQQ
jgi:cell division control protein 6